MMTLLGLLFDLWFILVKGTWISTAIPAKWFRHEVEWWRHTLFCNHECSGRRV